MTTWQKQISHILLLDEIENFRRGLRYDLPTDTPEHNKLLNQVFFEAEHKNKIDHLYECLTILDQKSAAMIQVDAILIAIVAIFMANVGVGWRLVLLLPFLVITAALLRVLGVISVHWTPTAELKDLEAESYANRLLDLRTSRTADYRVSWLLSYVGILTLAVLTAAMCVAI